MLKRVRQIQVFSVIFLFLFSLIALKYEFEYKHPQFIRGCMYNNIISMKFCAATKYETE